MCTSMYNDSVAREVYDGIEGDGQDGSISKEVDGAD